MFILTNNNFARASRYFVHFFAVVAHNTKIGAFFFVSPNIAYLVLLMVAVVLKNKQTNKQKNRATHRIIIYIAKPVDQRFGLKVRKIKDQ